MALFLKRSVYRGFNDFSRQFPSIYRSKAPVFFSTASDLRHEEELKVMQYEKYLAEKELKAMQYEKYLVNKKLKDAKHYFENFKEEMERMKGYMNMLRQSLCPNYDGPYDHNVDGWEQDEKSEIASGFDKDSDTSQEDDPATSDEENEDDFFSKPYADRSEEELKAMYERYLVMYGKVYEDPKEKEQRFENFKHSLRYVEEGNAATYPGYLKINDRSDYFDTELHPDYYNNPSVQDVQYQLEQERDARQNLVYQLEQERVARQYLENRLKRIESEREEEQAQKELERVERELEQAKRDLEQKERELERKERETFKRQMKKMYF